MPTSEQELLDAVAQLPKLFRCKAEQKNEVFCKKLKFCCVLPDFRTNRKEMRLKQVKRQTLYEIIEFVDYQTGIHTELAYSLCTQVFAVNVFRTVPFKVQFFDYPDDAPDNSRNWGHQMLIYQFFLKFMDHHEFQPSKAKKYFTLNFVSNIVTMFHLNVADERDQLKTCLHRIYAKFLGLRSSIRKMIGFKMNEMSFEDVKFQGVEEILEIMGSIINGYVRPFKAEHIQFLMKVLLPLHICKDLSFFHPQLVYCVMQFVEKDDKLMISFVRGFLKRWPRQTAVKEVLFLGELEEIIDVMQPREFAILQEVIMKQIASSLRSEHYQVCERALYFWENEYIVSLMEVNHTQVIPIVLPALLHAGNYHWNKTTSSLANEVLHKFISPGKGLFDKMVAQVKKRKINENQQRKELTANGR